MSQSPSTDGLATEPTDTGPLVVRWTCAGCGGSAVGPICSGCGRRRLTDGTAWPEAGEVLQTDEGPVRLLTRRPLAADGARFDGILRGQPCAVLVTATQDPEDLHGWWATAAERAPGLIEPVRWTGTAGAWRLSVVPAVTGPTLADGLAALREGGVADFRQLNAAIERWILPLVDALARVHDRGQVLGLDDPEDLRWVNDALTLAAPPPRPGAATRRQVRGFSSPEHLGHCGGVIDARSDVFFAGLALYYLLARVPPIEEASDFDHALPPPHVYRDELPPELCAVARRAVSPLPDRRYADARALLAALRTALRVARRRVETPLQRVRLDIGQERHIGVLKGQYAPINQDDLFIGFHAPSGIGLFVVSDGVSISEHGSGDLASGCVKAAAVSTWQAVLEGRPGETNVDEDITLDGLDEVDPALPENEAGRRAVLKAMIQSGNARIAQLVHRSMPRFVGPPEGIMAATTVAALLEGNQATLMSIGDSRIYLVRDGHIASLMVDHDLGTQLMRMGHPPRVARSAPSAAALIRCVGEFEKDAEDHLIPADLKPEFRRMSLLPGDALLLCSDGIPDYAGYDEADAEDRMREIVETAPGARWAAFELMVLANRGGGGDNISCIVIRVGADEQGLSAP
ncbi:MAG: protein phosphatase 2C domain-containing protein [Myxococcales bacterium]|nr:protein phosphatase 2C domain-containing protein [Myxococcales bacterium]